MPLANFHLYVVDVGLTSLLIRFNYECYLTSKCIILDEKSQKNHRKKSVTHILLLRLTS